jgi:hypothetical protein
VSVALFIRSAKLQSKARIEFSTVVRAATSQAGNRASYLAHALEIAAAVGTSINETRCMTFHWKGKVVAAHLVNNAKIATCVAPFCAMR